MAVWTASPTARTYAAGLPCLRSIRTSGIFSSSKCHLMRARAGWVAAATACLLESANKCLREFRGVRAAANVARERFSLAIELVQRSFDAARRFRFAEMIEHHD